MTRYRPDKQSRLPGTRILYLHLPIHTMAIVVIYYTQDPYIMIRHLETKVRNPWIWLEESSARIEEVNSRVGWVATDVSTQEPQWVQGWKLGYFPVTMNMMPCAA
jgi:hypothetical protein